MKNEVWKDIIGYEGFYQISNHGNVRGLMFSNNKVIKPKIHSISKTDNGNGYLYISLSLNGKRKNKYVHRLVAEAFVKNQNKKTVVNHLDYNKKNNYFKNLEWCTTKENVLHSVELMRKPKSKCKPTNTGEKYISCYNGRYSFYYKKTKTYKSFSTFSEAVEYKREVMPGV